MSWLGDDTPLVPWVEAIRNRRGEGEVARKKADPMAWNEVARLEMVVTFEKVPSRDELERVLEEARCYGSVEKATFTVSRPMKEELV